MVADDLLEVPGSDDWIPPPSPCSEDDRLPDALAACKLLPGQRKLCFQKAALGTVKGEQTEESSFQDDDSKAKGQKSVASNITGAEKVENRNLLQGAAASTSRIDSLSWCLSPTTESSSTSSSSSSSGSDSEGHMVSSETGAGPGAETLRKAVDVKSVPCSRSAPPNHQGRVGEVAGLPCLPKKGDTLPPHSTRSRSPPRMRPDVLLSADCVRSSIRQAGSAAQLSVPQCAPGQEHWVEPLWAFFEATMMERGPPARKLTLESLCSGTGAELHCVEVQEVKGSL